jgi:hypothetical protein
LGEETHDITNRTTEKELAMVGKTLPQPGDSQAIWDNFFRQHAAQNQLEETILKAAINNGGMAPNIPPDQIHQMAIQAFKDQGLDQNGAYPALYGKSASVPFPNQPATPQNAAPVTQQTAAPQSPAPTQPAFQLPPMDQRKDGMIINHPRYGAVQWSSSANGWTPATPTQDNPQTQATPTPVRPIPGTDDAAQTAPLPQP